MMALPGEEVTPRMTLDEYLAFEEASDLRHEFHDGEVLEVTAATASHSRIVRNVIRRVTDRLDGSPYELFESSMRVGTLTSNRFVYPDSSIACGPPEFVPDHARPTVLLNPRVIIEVLATPRRAATGARSFTTISSSPASRNISSSVSATPAWRHSCEATMARGALRTGPG